jgi:hypothetical protein
LSANHSFLATSKNPAAQGGIQMEFNINKGNRHKHSIKAFTRIDKVIACMTLGQPTLSQIGGTEP